jgi:septal ring factor EnvC (AmiA/AmiB activator)
MSSFRSPDLLERRSNAATIKKMMLEKFRAARQDPALEQQRLKRIAVNEARAFRTAEREATKKVREAELAAQATLAAELAAQARLEAEKAEALAKAHAAARDASLAAEKKAERDARYAARKVAKPPAPPGLSSCPSGLASLGRRWPHLPSNGHIVRVSRQGTNGDSGSWCCASWGCSLWLHSPVPLRIQCVPNLGPPMLASGRHSAP